MKDRVKDSDALAYIRVFTWWLLVQSCATLRFSDRRGFSSQQRQNPRRWSINPFDTFQDDGNRQTWQSQPIVMDLSAFLKNRTWLRTGWKLLKAYLLPPHLQVSKALVVQNSSAPWRTPYRTDVWTRSHQEPTRSFQDSPLLTGLLTRPALWLPSEASALCFFSTEDNDNDNDNDSDTLREVPHQSNEGLALQARVSGP